MLGVVGWLQSRAYDLWIGLKPSRFGLLAVLLLGVLLMEPFTGQGSDVLLEYGTAAFSEDDLRRRLFLYLATFCFAILTWFFCRQSGRLRFEAEEEVLRRYRTQFPRVPFDRKDSKQEQAIAADAEARVRNILGTRVWAPRILAMAIPLVVAVAIVWAGGLAAENSWAWLDVLILVGLAVLVGAVVIPRRLIQNWVAKWLAKKNFRKLSKVVSVGEAEDTVPTWEQLGGVSIVATSLVVMVVIGSLLLAGFVPVQFGPTFGPLPVVMLTLTVILGLGTLLAMVSRLTNFPWFATIIMIPIVLLAIVLSEHKMRFVADPDGDVDKRKRPSELASTFADAQQGSAPKVAILVATAGGGSRAAYWTTTVLGELNRRIPDFNEHLLVISGVSGGSLGALFYRAATQAAPHDPNKALCIGQKAASGDFLSPALSSMFTGELIVGLPDRAESIEKAWSASFDKACREELELESDSRCPVDLELGFLQLWPDPKRPWPALILNGTVVESGGRAVASSLKLDCKANDRSCASALVDVADLLTHAQGDLVASTAANVSARFPIVGPSARVRVTEKDEKSVVDGGYFDNFGATTLIQVMAEMSRLFKSENIVPIVIQITSDPDLQFPAEGLGGRLELRGKEPGGPQLFEPLETFQSLRSSHGRQAMLALKTLVEGEFGGAYVHFGQCRDVSGSGAPLAWVISRGSQNLLKENAKSSTDNCNNAASFQRVADYLASVQKAASEEVQCDRR